MYGDCVSLFDFSINNSKGYTDEITKLEAMYDDMSDEEIMDYIEDNNFDLYKEEYEQGVIEP